MDDDYTVELIYTTNRLNICRYVNREHFEGLLSHVQLHPLDLIRPNEIE